MPISVEHRAAIVVSRVQAAQLHRDSPTFMLEYVSTPVGSTKIPAPMTLMREKFMPQPYPNTLLSYIVFPVSILTEVLKKSTYKPVSGFSCLSG